jgi:hypothetical protein
MNPRIDFIVLATNSYLPLGIRLYKNLCRYMENFHMHMVVNTDVIPFLGKSFTDRITTYRDDNKSWVECMYMKFRWARHIAENHSRVFYLDADTNLKKKIDYKQLLVGDLVGAEHFNNRTTMAQVKNYERNPISAAYIPFNTPYPQTYYQGAFFGGKSNYVAAFCDTIESWKETDKQINFEPGVNDESYINKFFHYNPRTTIKLEDFPFIISCKGGIQNTRQVKSPWDRQGLEVYKDAYINILNGRVRAD